MNTACNGRFNNIAKHLQCGGTQNSLHQSGGLLRVGGRILKRAEEFDGKGDWRNVHVVHAGAVHDDGAEIENPADQALFQTDFLNSPELQFVGGPDQPAAFEDKAVIGDADLSGPERQQLYKQRDEPQGHPDAQRPSRLDLRENVGQSAKNQENEEP